MTCQQYYIDPNDPDDWRKALRDAATITLFFLIGMAICAIFHSCTMQKVIERTDTLVVNRSDTIRTTEVKENNVTRYVDRWRNNLYIVNPLTGDTTKQIQKEYVMVYYSQEQHDSIDRYRAMCDSLTRILQERNEMPKEKKLNWWQQFKIDTYMYIFISLLATIALWIAYHYYRNKRPYQRKKQEEQE